MKRCRMKLKPEEKQKGKTRTLKKWKKESCCQNGCCKCDIHFISGNAFLVFFPFSLFISILHLLPYFPRNCVEWMLKIENLFLLKYHNFHILWQNFFPFCFYFRVFFCYLAHFYIFFFFRYPLSTLTNTIASSGCYCFHVFDFSLDSAAMHSGIQAINNEYTVGRCATLLFCAAEIPFLVSFH